MLKPRTVVVVLGLLVITGCGDGKDGPPNGNEGPPKEKEATSRVSDPFARPGTGGDGLAQLLARIDEPERRKFESSFTARLLEGTRSADRQTRLAALGALSQFRLRAGEIVPLLEADLAKHDPGTVGTAIALLGGYGADASRAVPVLLRQLGRHRKLSIWRLAMLPRLVLTLGQIGYSDRQAMSELETIAKGDWVPRNQRERSEELGRMRAAVACARYCLLEIRGAGAGDAHLDFLVQCVKASRHPDNLHWAALCLGRLGKRAVKAENPLRELLGDRIASLDMWYRAALIRIVGKEDLLYPKIISTALGSGAFADPDYRVEQEWENPRTHARWALAEIGESAGRWIVLWLKKDRDAARRPRDEMGKTLSWCGEAGIEAARQILDTPEAPDAAVCAIAANALCHARFRGIRTAPSLLRFVRSVGPDPKARLADARKEAVRALALMGCPLEDAEKYFGQQRPVLPRP